MVQQHRVAFDPVYGFANVESDGLRPLIAFDRDARGADMAGDARTAQFPQHPEPFEQVRPTPQGPPNGALIVSGLALFAFQQAQAVAPLRGPFAFQ